MQYQIIGDDSAPVYFVVDETSGEIKLRESVKEDTKTEYQVSTTDHMWPAAHHTKCRNVFMSKIMMFKHEDQG